MPNEAGVHRTYVEMLERGQGNPSLHVIAKLAVALGVGVWDLLTTGSK